MSPNGKLAATFALLILIFVSVSVFVYLEGRRRDGCCHRGKAAEHLVNQIDDALQAMLEQAVNLRGFLLFKSERPMAISMPTATAC